MILKAPRETGAALRRRLSKLPRRPLMLAAAVCVSFGLGAAAQYAGLIEATIRPLAKPVALMAIEAYASIRHFGEVPDRIAVHVKHEDYQRLAYKRELALLVGKLVTSEDDMVPARLHHGQREVRGKIRLKGDHLGHLVGDKWSFRARVRGDDTLLGMKEFSLHHPQHRNYLNEWIYHRMLKREEVIALRYELVDLILNGKDLGVYAIEEHFDKRLIENNRRREGPIVRFNEGLMWEEALQFWVPFDQTQSSTYGSYLSSDIDAFQTSAILADSSAYAVYRQAADLVDGFRSGSIPTTQAFDAERLAAFLAISDILGAEHGAIWHNVRYYYNPVTALLEPIGFDGGGGKAIESCFATRHGFNAGVPATEIQAEHENDLYQARIFNDLAFYEQYARTLARVSEPAYLDSIFVEFGPELERNERLLSREYLGQDLNKQTLYRNQAFTKAVLNPAKGFHAHLDSVGATHVLISVGSIQPLPLNLSHASVNDSLRLEIDDELLLTGRSPYQLPRYDQRRFRLPEGLAYPDSAVVRVHYRMVGSDSVRTETAFPFPTPTGDLADGDFLRQPANADEFDFVKIDDARRKIRLQTGDWTLRRDLILPEGYSVTAGAGFRVDLRDGAKILSRSRLEFLGTRGDSISVFSSDGTGQGLLVIAPRTTSRLEYVSFHNLSEPSDPRGWTLTGAVTFYESSVEITGCNFASNRCEDALNLIRGRFRISDSRFHDTHSDALDADFAEGRITSTTFTQCGNDGIDVSGTTLEVSDVRMDGIGDKGLSIGEKSRLEGRDIVVRNAEIAIAAKDLSLGIIQGIALDHTRVGVTLFRKKPEFGPAHLTMTGLTMTGTEVPYLVEIESSLEVDGAAVPADLTRVEDQLYGVVYGKRSE